MNTKYFENFRTVFKGRCNALLRVVEEPILEAKKHRFTKFIIKNKCHHRVLHGDVQESFSDIQTEFWFLQVSQQVQSRIKTYHADRRWLVTGKHYLTPPSRLESDRFLSSKSFSVAGIDYTRAFTFSKEKWRPEKTAFAY